jgi:hypothetical protein
VRVAGTERTNLHSPGGLRSVNCRRARLGHRGDEDGRGFVRTTVGAHQAVIAPSPRTPVAQAASGAVVKEQRKWHRRSGRMHDGKRVGVGHPAQPLVPGVVETQQDPLGRWPTHVGPGRTGRAGIDVVGDRRPRRAASEHSGDVAGTLPGAHQPMTVDRMPISVDSHHRNDLGSDWTAGQVGPRGCRGKPTRRLPIPEHPRDCRDQKKYSGRGRDDNPSRSTPHQRMVLFLVTRAGLSCTLCISLGSS